MFFLLAAQAAVSSIKALTKPLEKLRDATALMAAEARGDKAVSSLQLQEGESTKLYLTDEEFEQVMAIPAVYDGWRQAQMLIKSGAIKCCDGCGAVVADEEAQHDVA